jgi:hypothetical protein
MRARYLIYTPVHSARDERRFKSAWGKFAEICRSLHQDGLNYCVELNLTHLKPHVLIVATGTPKPRKQPATRGLALPMPIPAQRCRDRALEAEWFLPENRERRKDGAAYWARHQERYRELSAMAEDFIRADAEFWRELEALSGQRQHFKPGSTFETRSDDEVAA